MIFEYIRPIDPGPARPEPEPVRSSDGPDLAELVSSTSLEETTPIACPELPGQRVELPRFAGMSLADVVLKAPPAPALVPGREHHATPSPSAPPTPEPRVLLGPGAMTMTLAIVATLVLGVAVAAQVH